MPSLSFLIAPDKFKGNLSAHEVAQALAKGVHDVLPSANIKIIPLADGGDGTGMILSQAFHARTMYTYVHGLLGKRIRISWGLHDSTAYLDFASACGLSLIPPHLRNPLKTSSRGVGELMKKAVRRGARHLVLGVGGSATVDGGVGAMRALGIRFLDCSNKEIPEGGGGLAKLQKADLSECIWRGQEIQMTILADVENPLLGKNGAAAVFGPQKGATPTVVQKLAKSLKRLDRVILQHHGHSLSAFISGGAAGGAVAGFVGLLGNVEGVTVRVTLGIDYVLKVLKVETAIKNAGWIFTGEGQLDSQTAHGKTIHGLVHLAQRYHKPIIAFVGRMRLSPSKLKQMGLTAAFTIAPAPCTLEESFRHSAIRLRNVAAQLTRLITSK